MDHRDITCYLQLISSNFYHISVGVKRLPFVHIFTNNVEPVHIRYEQLWLLSIDVQQFSFRVMESGLNCT